MNKLFFTKNYNQLIFCISFLSVCFLVFSCKSSQNNANQIEKESKGFKSIFNAENFEGWEGDSKYWYVENGILIGEVRPETILKSNSFIIYKLEQPEDFELNLEYRISEAGNSGINYRSEISDFNPYALKGYQLDIDGQNKYTGQNYEEKKRTTLAYKGERVVINPVPKEISSNNLRSNISKNCWQTRDVAFLVETPEVLESKIKKKEWNKVHLIVKGNRMKHYINGVLFSDVTDLDTVNRTFKGYIGVQVHVGPPMKVEYKNIKLKNLKNDK